MTAARNSAGYTLVELLTVIAIIAILAVIGVETIENFDASSWAHAQQDANGVRESLTYAQMLAMGSSYPVVFSIWPAGGATGKGFYALCFDTAGTGTCGSQTGITVQQPDTWNNYKGNLINYASFGVSPGVGQLSGTAILNGSIYYEQQGGAVGNNTDLVAKTGGAYTVTFNRDGSAVAGNGNIYLSLTQNSSGGASNSFDFAVTVNGSGKVNLWQLGDINGTTAWKMQQ